MNLVVVESPTKARTISRFLGNGWHITSTMGHVRDLPKSVLGIDIEHNFRPLYQNVPKREDVIKNLQKEEKKVQKVFLATDPDREGEAIAWHIKWILGNRDSRVSGKHSSGNQTSRHPDVPIERVTFHEITKEAIEEALA